MQDAFAYCAELVRRADRDRFIASLFAPAQHRGALHALYAFNAEVTRVRDMAHVALPGEIRLQWWSEVITGERGDEASANPVAAALLSAIERYRLSPEKLTELIEAHRFDLYDDPMASVADLENYARRTSSALLSSATQILAGTDAEAICLPAGIAYGLTGLLRAFPQQVARRQLYCRWIFWSVIRSASTIYLPAVLPPVSTRPLPNCATLRAASYAPLAA